MENFRMYESSTSNILEELKNRSYIIENHEIQEVIDGLYELVGVNEDYIDGAILAIENLYNNNEAFKKEWFGALDEVESEVLEESKLGKLASIALLALSMGISLTGCDVAPQLPQEPPRVEASLGASAVEDPIKEEPIDTADSNNREEINMEETKPTYEEIKDRITWYSKSGSFNLSTGRMEYEITMTDAERDNLNQYGVPSKLERYAQYDIEYSIDGGERIPLSLRNLPYTV